MKRISFLAIAGLMVAMVILNGCKTSSDVVSHDGEFHKFTLAWSEYPSWSVFGVAQEKGLITGNPDNPGTLEKKWKVIIDLKQVDYDTCINMYSSGTADATCMTNMDALNPALGRFSTAIMPTSTSFGADACIAVGIDTPEQLKGVEVFGLEKSVSEYAFVRALQKKGLKWSDYKFKNMDPAAAAQAMQTGKKGVKAIMVRTPFVFQTLRTVKDSKRLFDSSIIPGEIVDMVVVANGAIGKYGSDAFCHCICETFYEVNKMLADKTTSNDTYVALGAKFSNLGVEDMRQCCKEAKFYVTPKEGIDLFSSSDFKEINRGVAKLCEERGIVNEIPKMGYNDDRARINFSTIYMKAVQSAK